MKKCACCGNYSLEDDSLFEICDVCNWQQDAVMEDNPDYTGGANYYLSLNEARNYWNKDLNKKEHITIGMLEMCLFSIAAKDGRHGTIKSLYEGKFITQEMDSYSKPEAP